MNLKGYIKLVVMAFAIMFLSANTTLGADELIIHHIPITPCSGTVDLYKNGTFFETYNLWWSAPDCVNSPSTSTATWGGNSTVQLIRNGYYPSNYWAVPNPAGQTVTFPEFFQIGDNVVWNKNEYSKGETAEITVSYNNSNFNTGNYNYQYDIIDPDSVLTRYQKYQYSSSETFQLTLNKVGVYQGIVWVTDETDPLTAIYASDYDNIIVTDGTSVSFVTFDHVNYKLGETATISWGISSSFWDNFMYNYIEIYKDGIFYDEIYYVDNFGTRDYKFPEIGKYTLKLYQTKLISQNNLLSTSLDSWVTYNPSYISINETVGVGQISNFSYKWGETPTQTGYKWAYIKHLNKDSGLWETENTIALSGTVKDTLYYSSVLIKKDGDYLIELCDLNFQCPQASQTFNSIYLPNTPIKGYQISLLNITSSKTLYSQGDLLQFDFQIDSSNFTNNTVTVEIYNNESKENYTLLTAQTEFEKHNYYLGQLYGNGQSQLRLIGTNSSNFRTVLASKPLTISIIDNEGYGLEIDKTHPCTGEEITVTAISPVNSTITFSDRLSKTYNFTGTRTWRIIPDGDMTISLENNYGLQKKSGLININDNCNQINIDQETAGKVYGLGDDKTNTGMVTNLIILIGMPIFWGLAFLLIAIYYLRNNSALILPVLFILINVEAVVGLLEPYTMYIVVITWLVIAMNFIFVQRKTTG